MPLKSKGEPSVCLSCVRCVWVSFQITKGNHCLAQLHLHRVKLRKLLHTRRRFAVSERRACARDAFP
jgi:hypothetical protein